MNNPIDENFDFYTDSPQGKDPDSYSPTLRRYHKYLWSKPLPHGELFELVDTSPKVYLHHKSSLGEFFLGSDAITHSYRNTKRMTQIIKQIPPGDVDALFAYGSTIGAYIIFPSKKINNQMTINGARGLSAKIGDRFDLTLECIRLFYCNIESPLTPVFHRYVDFFNLFQNFKGYVNFFLLQDLVTEDYSKVNYHLQHGCFDDSPFPADKDEYLEYKESSIKFIKARGQRMVSSLKK